MSSSHGAKILLLTRILALRVFLVVRLSMSLLPRWLDDAITYIYTYQANRSTTRIAYRVVGENESNEYK